MIQTIRLLVFIGLILSQINATRLQDSKQNSLGRVVGGRDADPHEYPFQVAIFYKGVGLLCGGSLYSKDTVITAAHCFDSGGSTSNYIVALGKHDMTKREDAEILSTVKSIINHPGYTSAGKKDDIAIVKLSTKTCLNEHINTIPIAKDGTKLPNEGFVSGWGYTAARKSGSQFSEENFLPTLKAAILTILEDEKCKQRFKELGSKAAFNLADYDKTFCAWHEEGHDSCQGDSGGPMFCMPSGNPPFQLCGIVSTGIGCGQIGTPALYTEVSKYYDWIITNAGPSDETCEP